MDKGDQPFAGHSRGTNSNSMLVSGVMLIICPHEISCTQQYHRPASGVRPLDNMNLKQNKYYFLWDKQTFGTGCSVTSVVPQTTNPFK